MIERILTDGEKFQIAYALKKYSTRARKRLSMTLGGQPNEEMQNLDKVPRLAEEQVRIAAELEKAAKSMENLADFLLRNKVTVSCTVTIPDQF